MILEDFPINRPIFQISIRLILLGTMFISSLPSYPAYARPHNSRREENDMEGDLTEKVINGSPLHAYQPMEPFVLLFSESMQIESSPQPLTITPPIEGQITWDEDAKYLTFEPIDGFVPDQTYTISLDPNLTSNSGKQFDELQSWTIHTFAGPSLLSRSPESLFISSRLPIIRLTFDQEMDAERFREDHTQSSL